MKSHRNVFYLGVFLALVIGAIGLDISTIEAVSQALSLANLPQELRMSFDLGILDQTDLRPGALNVPMEKRAFAALLKATLQLLGDPAGSTLEDLEESGILDTVHSRRSMSRRAALETLCRAVIHFADLGQVRLPPNPGTGFSDYQPPPKYQLALAFLKERRVAQGYGDNRFGARRALTKREGAYLIYRLYEQVSNLRVKRAKSSDITFVDLPTDHVAMDGIRAVFKAGGFDQIQFRPSFDGYNTASYDEASNMMKGILMKGRMSSGLDTLALVTAHIDPANPASRGQWAALLHLLLKCGIPLEKDREALETYVDVAPGSPEGEALIALGKRGILLGYSGGRFKGEEFITRFELLGTLNAVLKTIELPKEMRLPEVSSSGDLVSKSEFLEYVNLMKAKRARVRNILSQRPLRKRTPVPDTVR